MKKLVIVESPAKAKTLKKILGDGYTIVASNGHVIDLPKSKIGIDVENDFVPEYITIKGREKILRELKKLAKESDVVYLASDPDREGESISWHLANALKLGDGEIRIEFNEVTRKAVLHAVQNPRKIDIKRVNAQQARRILDRLVGYEISPLLWKRLGYNTSAGRVQSVALRLICELEDTIKAFVSETFWTVEGFFEKELTLGLYKIGDDKADKIKDKKLLPEIEKLKGENFSIDVADTKEKKSSPSMPFKTSSLQQSASSELGYSPSRTMRIAQGLYEGIEVDGQQTGLITYMRTDSVRISGDAISESKMFIKEKYGDKYLGPIRQKKQKDNVQDAHECVRPTSVYRTPEDIKKFLSDEQFKLYNLIFRRFLSSQLADMVYDQLELVLAKDKYSFRGLFNKVKFDGYTILTKLDEDRFFTNLPDFAKGDNLKLEDLTITEGETKPPARLTEASLIKRLEKEGIGRPSTYASIVETLKKREYVTLEEKKFQPTNLGHSVKDSLLENFPSIMDLKFTSAMENSLDEIADGKEDWVALLKAFYQGLSKHITAFKDKLAEEKDAKIETDVTCSECKEKMILKNGRFGEYLQCANDHKMSLPKGSVDYAEKKEGFVRVKDVVRDEKQKRDGIPTDFRLEGCSVYAKLKEGPYGPYLECETKEGKLERKSLPKSIKLTKENLQNPKIAIAEQLTAIESERRRVEDEAKPCEKCKSKMVVRDGKYGPFLSCSGYPKCKNLQKYPKGN